ncbi:carboxymuconolactone decarboxylase family protein [Alteromonas sp. NFXS44]|uniref:carboxymuconolactone decarboxylase family protein n=1 Tax=Alteromonas sp. NFXS44 TaxID=2818435 RepID=UPI0032DE3E80
MMTMRTTEQTDPEFMAIQNNFVENDLGAQDVLTPLQKHISLITALAVQQSFPQLKRQVRLAIDDGIAPVTIRESLYVAAPFTGFPKIENALVAVNEVFNEKGIVLPLPSQARNSSESRYQAGLAIQVPIYGNEIKNAFADLPEPYDEKLPAYLTELLFGDFYTRSAIDNQTRELVALITLATLGAEKQLASHARGNLIVGNTKPEMIGALVHCLPALGFPAVFNAINEVRNINID